MFIECKDCIHNMKCPCGWSYACAACLTIQKQYDAGWCGDALIEAINNAPTIEAERTGKWIVKKDWEGKTRRCICDQCGHDTGLYTWKNPNYCEDCGARMVE